MAAHVLFWKKLKLFNICQNHWILWLTHNRVIIDIKLTNKCVASWARFDVVLLGEIRVQFQDFFGVIRSAAFASVTLPEQLEEQIEAEPRVES